MYKTLEHCEFDLLASLCKTEKVAWSDHTHSVNWQRMLELAAVNKVSSLVYQQLENSPGCTIPADALQTLHRRFQQNVQRTLKLTAELVKLLKALAAAGVSAMPWKGPVLAKGCYGQIFRREFIDLDILVPQDQWLHAFNVLRSRGYQPARDLGNGPAQCLKDDDRYCELLLDPAGEIGVELHWRFAAKTFRFDIDYQQLWGTADKATFSGAPIRVPPPELELINLCAHGSRHYWKRLSWVADVHYCVTARKDWDWGKVVSLARRSGSMRMLGLGLALTQRVLGTALPQLISDHCHQDARASSLAGIVHRRLREGINLQEANKAPRVLTTWNLLYMLRIRENLGDGCSQIGRMFRTYFAPNSRDRAVVELPSELRGLYFLIRPLRLASAYTCNRLQNFRLGTSKAEGKNGAPPVPLRQGER
jgi:hypothetical protein